MLRVLVEAEIRRPDDDDRVSTDLGGMGGESHRLGSGLRAALNGHLQSAVRSLEKEIGDEAPLALVEQDSLPCRPEHEHTVEAGVDEEVHERLERTFVQLRPHVP